MPIIQCEQRSPEWLAMRIGAVTASRMGDVMAKLKRSAGEAAARSNYRRELVVERLTGLTADHYVSTYMEWGMDSEPLARAAYEIRCDVEADPIGYAMHPTIQYFGGSPDSLVGDDGLLEIKCLKSENHFDILNLGEIPEEYHPQLLAELSVTERQWVDFVSFDNRMPKKLQLFVKRFHRDEEKIAAMEAEVTKFLSEVDAVMEKLRQEDSSSLIGALTRSLETVGQ